MAQKSKLQLHEELDHVTHGQLREGIDSVLDKVEALANRVNMGIGILITITFLAANGMLNLSNMIKQDEAQAATGTPQR
tara:strand:- start:899 stop:1135 length:237 start_codon:yes stop_codon:yes gene_type:complete